MRNGNKKIRVSRIYKRFILSFAIVLLLPVGCFTFIFLQNYREIYREKVLGLAESSLEASVMELERTIESLENFVSYNLMAGSLSEEVLLKDCRAAEAGNILSAEVMAQPILKGVSYYNANLPDTIYVEDGTFEPAYYAQVYMSMENEEVLLKALTDPENAGWVIWKEADITEGVGVPALWYVARSWADECWIFRISQSELERIINTEKAVTVLQDSEGQRLYPFPERESAEASGFIGDMEGYCEITAVASDGSFMLTRYMEEAYLFAEINAWQKSFFIIFMVVLVLGGVLILVLTTFNENPIRKLQQDWRKKIPDMPENAIGLDALQFAMKSMEEQVAILETKQQKNQLLLEMIHGKECETKRFKNKVNEAGLFKQAEVYRVMIAVSNEEQENKINKWGVYLDMFMEEGYEFRRIEMSGVGASIIIAGMTLESDKQLEQKLLEIVEQMEQSENEKIFIYVGERYERMDQIHLSYSEALSCNQNKEKSKEAGEAKRVTFYQLLKEPVQKKDKKEETDKEAHIISKVLAFIEENSRSCDLSVSMIAYHFDISISNLSHQFKAQVNRTISDYIAEKKFAYAQELLLTTDYSVQKIASMTGYSQPASFIRKFRQYYGMTPVEYRNTAGGSNRSKEVI